MQKMGTFPDFEPHYVVITPARNEAEYIEKTLSSMIQQTILPVNWVIVNDGSSDATADIVQQHTLSYPWIKLMNRSDRGYRQRGKGVIEAFYAGLDLVDHEYDFLVKLDGDVSFEPDYFACLLSKFQAEPQLGIAGGGVYERPDGKTWKLWAARDHVRGPTKIYRRTCFEMIGGLVPGLGWDGIDEWKALALGWKVQTFYEHKIFHYRSTGAAGGSIHHRLEQGMGAYAMGYHPLFQVVRGFRHMVHRPYFVGGVAMIWGYLLAGLRKQERLADPVVRQYVRRSQMKQLSGLVLGKPVHDIPHSTLK